MAQTGPSPLRSAGHCYAEVAVRLPLSAYTGHVRPGPTSDPGTFTYRLPDELAPLATPGQIVEVPFGRRRAEGVIVELRAESPLDRTLDILRIVDERPAMASEAPRLARWMSKHYLTPFAPCLQAMLAPQAIATVESAYQRTRQPVANQALSPTELAVLGAFSHRRRLSLPQLRARVPGIDPRAALERLIELGLLKPISLRSAGSRRPRPVRLARLLGEPPLDSPGASLLRRSSRARAVIDALRHNHEGLPLPELRQATRATTELLERLEATGIVAIEDQPPELWPQPRAGPSEPELWSPTGAGETGLELAGPELSPDQARAWETIRTALQDRPADPTRRTILLHGVTGSGKTELYLRAIGHELAQGRQTIVLVPEIALTPQAIQRFAARFGDSVGVWHSALGYAARHDTWRLAQRGGYGVILGSRSAIFAPLPNLGLIVIDEEHSDSYKQPAVPRYHAREVALERAALVGAVVILGSATPAIETYWAARQGLMQLLELPRRIAVPALSQASWAADSAAGASAGHRSGSSADRAGSASGPSAGPGTGSSADRAGSASGPSAGPGGGASADRAGSASGPSAGPGSGASADRAGSVSGPSAGPGSGPSNDQVAGSGQESSADNLAACPAPAAATEDLAARGPVMGSAESEAGRWWAPLPEVEVVDMREELRAGNTSLFSRSLQQALQEVLARGEQAILFLNRRGTSTFVLCRDCGHVQSCPRCQLPLTFHTAGGDLVCHHCNHRELPPLLCPGCGLTRIRYFGAGTQKVVAAAQELWPQARLLRWDADTTTRRGAHDRLLAAFAGGQADILIGTQMIAKGLDLPRVTLVGIVAADTSLHLPDFRSGERTFQLLTQVAGRAGRSTLGGRVILQTYRPEAPPIRYAARHDYAAFYAEELEFRREGAYPPFRRLVRLEFRSSGSERAAREATEQVARALQARIENLGLDQTELVGPAPAFFGHLGGKRRWQVVVKARQPQQLLEGFHLGPGWHVDVDPVDLL